MEDRLVIRISLEEKEDLALIAKDLGISLSALARNRLLGENLKDMYLQLIKYRIDQLPPGKEFTLKKILPVHWSYLSKSDREYLVEIIEDEADDDELQIEIVEKKSVENVNLENVKMMMTILGLDSLPIKEEIFLMGEKKNERRNNLFPR